MPPPTLEQLVALAETSRPALLKFGVDRYLLDQRVKITRSDLRPIVPALEEVLGGALGENVGRFNFKAITDRFSELMYDYPFRVPARFALIIRAVVSQEGLALRLDPDFRIIRVA